MKITVLDSGTLGEDINLSPLLAVGECEFYPSTAPKDVANRIKDSDVVVINKVKLFEDNLKDAENLKLICLAATGYDNVDVKYCKSRGIAVCNVTGYSTHSVAQVAVSLVLSLFNHITEYSDFVKSGEYTKSGIQNRLTPVYRELCGKTWGIVGYGNIGKQVGKVAEAFGCNTLVCKKTPDSEKCVDIDTLCRESDIITVHTPLTPETRELINRDRIALMKRDAILVNVARGAVVDEAALCDAVKERRVGGIGVDVFSVEPMEENSPYTAVMNLPNVILTPHMAWGSFESRCRCIEEIAENIKAFFSGEKRNRVD